MPAERHEVHLKSLPAGSSAKGLRSFFEHKAIHLELVDGGREAVVRFATAADAEFGRKRWESCQAVLSNERSTISCRGVKRARTASRTDSKQTAPFADSKQTTSHVDSRQTVSGEKLDPTPASKRPSTKTKELPVPVKKPQSESAPAQHKENTNKKMKLAPEKTEAAARLRAQSLTYEIAGFAAKRQLAKAVETFSHFAEEGIAPAVQAFAALINAHVNSGDLDGATQAFDSMRVAGLMPNVIVYTALLKGHCRIGDLKKAATVFDDMSKHQPPVLPDLRAVNTFLRGCARVGDVQTAAVLFSRLGTDWQLEPDSAARMFMVRLFCQGLRLDDAREVIKQQTAPQAKQGMKVDHSSDSNNLKGGEPCLFWAEGKCKKGAKCRFYHDPAIEQKQSRRAKVEAHHSELEHLGALGAMHVDFAHAAALLSNWSECEAALNMATSTLAQMDDIGSVDDTFKTQHESTRFASETDIMRIQSFAKQRTTLALTDRFGLCFNFPMGSDGKLSDRLLNALGEPFGLNTCVQLGIASLSDLKCRFRKCITPRFGRLQWQRVFGQSRKDLPVKLEIGAGSGEWIVAQARAELSSANWVALELMHDRVYSIFSRAALEDVHNLCTLGGDATQILPKRVPQGSVDHVFANFPEPPHVSGSEAAESSLHVWSDQFFKDVRKALKPQGRVTILSDNPRYCRSLARTVADLQAPDGSPFFMSVTVPLCTGDQKGKRTKKRAVVAEVHHHEDIDGICLHHGTPGNESGHVVKSVSQFDKRWESTQRTERYFLSLLAQ